MRPADKTKTEPMQEHPAEEEEECSEGEEGISQVDAQAQQEPVIKTEPKAHSQEEVERHNVTHAEFEAWCKHCVMGQAVSDPTQEEEA